MPTLDQSLVKSALIKNFDSKNLSFNGGLGYSQLSDNHDGVLGNDEPFYGRAYASMYQATGDSKYLHLILDHVLTILSNRDDVYDRQDYRGIAGACWANTSYTQAGQSYAFLLHDCSIILPMAQFYFFVRNSAGRAPAYELYKDGRTLVEIANALEPEIRATLAYHEDEWDGTNEVYKFRSDLTFTVDSWSAGDILPWNMQAPAGLCYAYLYAADKKKADLDRVSAMSHALLNAMGTQTGNWYYWNYNPSGTPQVEDVIHGSYELELAISAYALGVQWTTFDIMKLRNTFMDKIYRGPDDFSAAIDGVSYSSLESDARRAIPQWVILSYFDRAVYDVVLPMFISGAYDTSFPSSANLFSHARMIEHYYNGTPTIPRRYLGA